MFSNIYEFLKALLNGNSQAWDALQRVPLAEGDGVNGQGPWQEQGVGDDSVVAQLNSPVQGEDEADDGEGSEEEGEDSSEDGEMSDDDGADDDVSMSDDGDDAEEDGEAGEDSSEDGEMSDDDGADDDVTMSDDGDDSEEDGEEGEDSSEDGDDGGTIAGLPMIPVDESACMQADDENDDTDDLFDMV
ncbi:MAG: hypothetical protein EX266_06970 [Rhodobacteraceae bacterium]|nr:MAG: hypothetical protein EX266_06970 [Paracoccaceae bacterium]